MLSRRHLLPFHLFACALGYQHLKFLYANDEDIEEIYSACLKHHKEDFLIQNGYLFKRTRLYIPKCDTCDLLIMKMHGGSLAGQYGEIKTLIMLRKHYYLHGMSKDSKHVLGGRPTNQVAKSHLLPQGLYTPLRVPTLPLADISMDFILGLL